MREKIWRYVLWFAIVLALGVGALQAIREERMARPLDPGTPAPAFSAPRRGAGQFDLAKVRGNVVMLSFWASWCAPCARELPVLQRLQGEFATRGVELVTANVDDADGREERVTSFLKRHGNGPVPVVVFPGEETVTAWRALRLPTLYIIAGDGRIVAGHSSVQDEAVLRRELEAALRAGPGT